MQLDLGSYARPPLVNIPVLRDYQVAAIEDLFNYYLSGSSGHPLITMPTGTGKSLVIAYIIKSTLTGYASPGLTLRPSPSCRVLVLTHSKELVENDAAAFARVMPGFDYGIYCADLNRKDKDKQVTFGSIQSVARNPHHFVNHLNPIRAVIIDEAHRVSPEESKSYLKVINTLQAVWPKLTVMGLTATGWRLDTGPLTANGIFTDCPVDYCSPEMFMWFIQQGYLIKPVPYRTQAQFDATGVKVRRGEFDDAALEEAMAKQNLIPRALEEFTKFGLEDKRGRWLVFMPSVRHVEEGVAWFQEHGISAVGIHHEVKDKDRVARLAAHKAGKVRVAVNQNVLTTGYDDPAIDYIGVVRPTLSSSLWVQMLGRGTRPLYAPGHDLSHMEGRLAAIQASPKHDCRVMDFAGNTRRLGPINDPVMPKAKDPDAPKKRKPAEAEPAAKECEVCHAWNGANARFCEECGAPFSTNYKTKADTAELVVDRKVKRGPHMPEGDRIYEVHSVTRMTALYHKSRNGKPSLLITYFTPKKAFRKYLTFGTPQAAALHKHWWRLHCPGYGFPGSVEAALVVSHAFRKPDRIRVWTNKPGDYPQEVTDYEFADHPFPAGYTPSQLV